MFFNNSKWGGGEGVELGSIWEKFQKKLSSKSPALLGLNLTGFTDLFYKEFHFIFFKEDFSTQPVT